MHGIRRADIKGDIVMHVAYMYTTIPSQVNYHMNKTSTAL